MARPSQWPPERGLPALRMAAKARPDVGRPFSPCMAEAARAITAIRQPKRVEIGRNDHSDVGVAACISRPLAATKVAAGKGRRRRATFRLGFDPFPLRIKRPRHAARTQVAELQMVGPLTALAEPTDEALIAALTARRAGLCAASLTPQRPLSCRNTLWPAPSPPIGICAPFVSPPLTETCRPNVVAAGRGGPLVCPPLCRKSSSAERLLHGVAAGRPLPLHPLVFLQGLRADQKPPEDVVLPAGMALQVGRQTVAGAMADPPRVITCRSPVVLISRKAVNMAGPSSA